MNILKKYLCVLISASILSFGAVNVSAADNSIDVTISTDKTGNIFFGNEKAEFDIAIENSASEDAEITVKYTVYKYNNEMKAEKLNENSLTLRIGAGESRVETIEPEAGEYALYRLDVSVGGETLKSADFSRSVKSTNANPTLGVSAHLTTTGDIHSSLMLVNNSGMTNIRDDFRWNEIERTKGDVQLNSRMKSLILNADSYGIDVLPVLFGSNALYQSTTDNAFVTDAAAVASYGTYLKKLMQTNEFKSYIKNVEILNEPDCAVIGGYTADDTSEAATAARGKAYAALLKEAYTSIKDVASDVNVGAFSTCSANSGRSINFVKSVLGNLDKKYFDAVTEHPYFGTGYTDEEHGSFGTLIKSLEDYHSNFTGTFANDKRWHTEFGSTTADDGGKGFSVENQYEQAVKAIRAYNTIKRYSFDDKLYLYCLSDNGTDLTLPSENYGMLKAYKYDTPYAAKATYLAVANMNNLIGDATNCETIEDGTDGAFVTKYTSDAKTVYMMYCKKNKTMDKSVNYEGAVYYDLFGNKLENFAANGSCQLTEAPVYAVIGEVASSDAVRESFTVSGNVPSGKSGRMVTMSIYEGNADFDTAKFTDMVYFDQQYTTEDGSFEFDIVLNTEKKYTAFVVSDDDTTPVCLSLSANSPKKIELNLYSGISKIKNVSLSSDELNKAYAKITYNGTSADESRLYLAVYNKNALVAIKIADVPASDGTLEQTVDLSGISADAYDNIKLMLWDRTEGIKPLCSALNIK